MENYSSNNIDIPIPEIGGGRRGSRTSPLPPQIDIEVEPPHHQHLPLEISYTKKQIGLISILFTIFGMSKIE